MVLEVQMDAINNAQPEISCSSFWKKKKLFTGNKTANEELPPTRLWLTCKFKNLLDELKAVSNHTCQVLMVTPNQ